MNMIEYESFCLSLSVKMPLLYMYAIKRTLWAHTHKITSEWQKIRIHICHMLYELYAKVFLSLSVSHVALEIICIHNIYFWNICIRVTMWRNMFELRSLAHQSWGAVVAACDGLATWPLAISLLTTRASTLEPNVVAWNAAISSCEKSTVWQKAFEVLHFMQRRRVEADETTWNTLISTCGRVSWWQKSIAVLERLTAVSVCSDLSARWFQGIDQVRREKGELEANYPCKLGRKMSLVSTYINMCQQDSHVELLYLQVTFSCKETFLCSVPFTELRWDHMQHCHHRVWEGQAMAERPLDFRSESWS